MQHTHSKALASYGSKAAAPELPIIQQENRLLVSAQLLHRKLKSGYQFSDWFKRRIKEYGFTENSDFFASEKSEAKTGRGGHNAIDYLLSLDTAKELAMVEKNEIGRSIRRYFITLEKQYRDWIGFILPRLSIEKDLFGFREGYLYIELLEKCQLSLKSGSRSARIRKNIQEFWRNSRGEICVSEAYGKTIITNAIARRLNIETKNRRLLPTTKQPSII